MNCKTLRELAAEAGLQVEKYTHPYGHNTDEVFAIITGDPWNTLTDLVEVVLDNIHGPGEDSLIEGTNTLSEVLNTLRSPKQFERGSDIILFWPKIKWEES